MKAISTFLFVTAGTLPLATADWQFKSRPDLSPPTLNSTIPAGSDVDNGYIFVEPYSSFEGPMGSLRGGPEQAAAYIFRDNGDLVWSSLGYLSAWIGNFQAKKWRGQPVLTAFEGNLDSFHGHGYGHIVLLDQNYEQIKVIRGANHRLISLHEASIINEETILVEIYQPVVADLTPYGGSKDNQWIVDCIFQELDIETGKLLFEWHSLDHVDPHESWLDLTSGRAFSGYNSTDAWDYFHINSVDKDDEGNYLVSGRHTSTIYKLNGTTGDIIWRLGGKDSTFKFPKSLNFAFQHDGRFHSRSTRGDVEVISFFDNSARSDVQCGGPIARIDDHSKARIVQINLIDKTASEVQTMNPPDNLLAVSQGNVQLLPNGNTFVNWGQSGAITEFRGNDSEAIFHAYLDSGIQGIGTQSYRGFRYNWIGTPNETPAIVALIDAPALDSICSAEFTVYVSWNGDTETTTWRFFYLSSTESNTGKTRNVQKNLLGESVRDSFETSLKISATALCVMGENVAVFAEAIDANGRFLSRTNLVHPENAVFQFQTRAKKLVKTERLLNQLHLGHFEGDPINVSLEL